IARRGWPGRTIVRSVRRPGQESKKPRPCGRGPLLTVLILADLLDELDAQNAALVRTAADARADRARRHEVDELALEARGRAIAGVALRLVVAVDVGVTEEERG